MLLSRLTSEIVPALAATGMSAILVLGCLAGCVDTTPPWAKVTPAGGTGGAGGAVLDGATAAGGAWDTGAGGAIDSGNKTTGGVDAGGGAGGAIDSPLAGAGGG